MKLRALLTGGEKLQRQAPRGFGCWLTNHYGPTESTVVTSAAVVEPGSDPATAPPIGCPIANTRVYLLDRYGGPVPIGVPGELHISGVGLAREYLNQPELTAEKFIPNPFAQDDADHSRLYKTGDLARYLADGNLEFLGRIDQQVKITGHRVEVGEIECVLGQYPEIRKAVVLNGGEGLKAYIVPPLGCESELRRFLGQRLPEYMMPSVFVFLEA